MEEAGCYQEKESSPDAAELKKRELERLFEKRAKELGTLKQKQDDQFKKFVDNYQQNLKEDCNRCPYRSSCRNTKPSCYSPKQWWPMW